MRALILMIILSAAPARADAPRVVTDIAPVQSLAAIVIGDLAEPQVLLDGASDPHDFQMRPSQARLLAGADLLIWMGPELTPWLDRARAATAPDVVSLALLHADRPPLRLGGKVAHFDDPARAADDNGHDHGTLDPHAWLDPLNAAFYLARIAEQLARLDPPNAATYAVNAQAATLQLERLHEDLKPQLEPVGPATLIAGHDAFSYLLVRYNLRLSGTLSDSAGTTARVAGLLEMRADLAEQPGPVCVLLEPGAPDDLVQSLNLSQPPRIVVLDPMGRDLPGGPDHYPAMMQNLAKALATCAAPSN